MTQNTMLLNTLILHPAPILIFLSVTTGTDIVRHVANLRNSTSSFTRACCSTLETQCWFLSLVCSDGGWESAPFHLSVLWLQIWKGFCGRYFHLFHTPSILCHPFPEMWICFLTLNPTSFSYSVRALFFSHYFRLHVSLCTILLFYIHQCIYCYI